MAESVTTVAKLLRIRAQDQPDRIGYVFLADGETDEQPMSYAEADRRARAVAAALREAGAAAGDRAMLVLPPGLDYVTAFFGCLYAGVVAVPVYPPDPLQLDRSLPRLTAIVGDARPVAALTIAPLLGYLDVVTERAPVLGDLRWIAVDDMPGDAAADGDPAAVEPDATAMLQYTSGSTAAPRGVMLSHRNLLHNSGLIQQLFGTTPDSQGMVWLPPYHDMGLIGGLIQPLYAGLRITLMSPLHFLEDPMRWLRAIDRYRIAASGGPNFAYELCVRRSDPEQVARLDLSSWRVAFNGAEPIRPETLRRFAETFAPSGFRPDAFLPCYGLAEATLIVSAAEVPRVVHVDRRALEQHVVQCPDDDTAAVPMMSCGRAGADQRAAIVDPATSTACPPDRVGEIWVSGPSVAQGYWGQPEETGNVFHARIAGEDGRAFLRTGDLGFVLDGDLVVTGRLKDLIIVRGQNHYPQDIELTAERADPLLRPGCSAAFPSDEDAVGGDLVLVHEVRRQAGEVDVAGVAARVRQAVAQEHGLQVRTVVLIRAGGMPKTPSGKVQRRLCRARLIAGELPEIDRSAATAAAPVGGDPAAPCGSRAEQIGSYLRGKVAEVGGIRPGDIDPNQPLLAAGLDSLAVLQLRQAVEKDLGVTVSLTAILAKGGTLAQLVDQVAGVAGRAGGPVGAAPAGGAGASLAADGVAAMSYGQRWVWLAQHFEPDSTVYNISVALRSAVPVDGAALRGALRAVVARHPILRATFPVRNREPVMLVHPPGEPTYQELDARDLDGAALHRRLVTVARRPFDLRSGPLLRLAVFRHPGGDVLLLSMHHIITDFWSMTVVARETGAYYTAYASGGEPDITPPSVTYLDVVHHERSILDDEATVARLARYWDEQVGDGMPALALPAGRSAGGSRTFALSPSLTERLHARATAERVTPYVLLLAAFQAVLHRYTGQDDLAIGTNVAGRSRPEFATVVGFCTSPVPIRSRIDAGASFRGLLSQTRDRVIGALEHQEYPATLLAERQRAAGRSATMFEVLFTVNRSLPDGDDLAALGGVGPAGARCSLGSLQLENVPLPQQPSGLPLELTMAEVGGALYGSLRYSAALDEPTVAQLVEQFVALLEAVAADPDVPIRLPGMRTGQRAVPEPAPLTPPR